MTSYLINHALHYKKINHREIGIFSCGIFPKRWLWCVNDVVKLPNLKRNDAIMMMSFKIPNHHKQKEDKTTPKPTMNTFPLLDEWLWLPLGSVFIFKSLRFTSNPLQLSSLLQAIVLLNYYSVLVWRMVVGFC